MAREQDRCPGGSRLRDDLADNDPRLGVEAGRRLVEQQDLGPADERHRQRQPLPLPAGQAAVRGSRHGREPQHREQLVGIPRILVVAGELDQGLARSRPRIEPAALEHQPEPRPKRPPSRQRVHAEDANGALVRPPIALDGLDGRRLARTVRPEQRHQLAGRDLERDSSDNGSIAVPLDEALDRDGRAARHGAISSYWRSKSSSRSSPIWIDWSTPSASMK